MVTTDREKEVVGTRPNSVTCDDIESSTATEFGMVKQDGRRVFIWGQPCPQPKETRDRALFLQDQSCCHF